MAACARCGVELRRARYDVRLPDGSASPRCLRHAILHPPLVRRSLIIALVVGTILTAINQGNLIAAGDFPTSLWWKVPLTYAVPYCVATAGAVLNARAVS
jgi:hypothetical protein